MTTNHIGETIINRQGLTFTITEKTTIKVDTHYLYKVHIRETNRYINCLYGRFKLKQVRDKYVPEVFGVGYNSGKKCSDQKLYRMWYEMLRRCYDERNKSYHVYGGKGVTVCSDWHDYSKFETDIKQLEGFELWQNSDKKYCIDKDIKGSGLLYNKDNCMFVTYKQQMQAQKKTKKVIATFPDGHTRLYNSINDCAEQTKVDCSTICKILKGKYYKDHVKNIKFKECIT